MVIIKVINSDSKIWNRDSVVADLSIAMCRGDDITLDLINEGPCFESLELVDLIQDLRQKSDYKKIIFVHTSNSAQKDIDGIKFHITTMMHTVDSVRKHLQFANTDKNIKKIWNVYQ